LSNPSVTTTEPTTAVHNVSGRTMARLCFGGTDAANETVNYQVILWFVSWLDDTKVWTPVLAAKGAFTLGTTALPTSLIAANGLFADTITETLAQPGSIARSPANDSIATLDIDLRDAELIQVETDRDTAATAYTMIQLSDREIGGFSDIEVAGVGMATSALQTAANTDLDTLLLYVSPPVQTALGAAATTTSTSWDTDTAELTLPANAVFVDVYCTTETYILCNTSADDPAVTPSCYPLLATSRIPCRGQTKLHYKAKTDAGTISGTAFCTA